MRASFLLFALAAVACGPRPYYVTRAPEEPPPTVSPTIEASVASDGGAAKPLTVADSPLVAEVVPGLERLSRIAAIDGALCGARSASSPICTKEAATTNAFLSVEALPTATRFEVGRGKSCSIAESGRFACQVIATTAFMHAGDPPSGLGGLKAALLTEANAQDFVLEDGDSLAVLGKNGVVTEIFKPREPMRLVQFQNAVEISLAGPSDQLLCARARAGSISCVRTNSLGTAPETIRDIEGEAVQLERGFARTKDDRVWAFGLAGARASSSALGILREGGVPLLARELAKTDLLCFRTPQSSVECADPARTGELGRLATRSVTLPGRPKTFRPAGAPCVELESGLVACWGDDLEHLRALGREVLERTPGAIQRR